MASTSTTKGLVLLESQNPILHEQLKSRILEGKRESCEVSFSDFDDVSFKLSSSVECPNIVKINIALRNAAILRRYGAEVVLQNLFPNMQTPPDSGFDFALEFDCNTISNPTQFLSLASDLKRHVLGSPIDNAFKALSEGQLSTIELVVIPYRKTESIFVCPGSGKIVIIFLVDFVDPTDKAIARVFLQQFAESGVRTAPPASFSRDPPGELTSLALRGYQDASGFISFAFEERHVAGSKRDAAVTLMTGFRTYLHYHIKCSKTHLHMRMRKQVSGWLQVLNRAMPETEQEKKTVTGKTFTRK